MAAAGLARSVFVTGSNRGIGLEFIKQLTEKGECPEFLFAACRSPSNAVVSEVIYLQSIGHCFSVCIKTIFCLAATIKQHGRGLVAEEYEWF